MRHYSSPILRGVANRFLDDLFEFRAEGRFRELPGYVFPAGPAHPSGSLPVGHQDGEGSGKGLRLGWAKATSGRR